MLSRGGDLDALRAHRPLRRKGLLRRLSILIGALALAFAAYPFGRAAAYDERFAAAAVLAFALLAAIVLTPWERLPGWAVLVPPLVYVMAIALLGDAHGGSRAGFAPLLLVAVLWLAIYATRRDFAIGLLAVVLALVLPIVLIGGERYPSDEWRRTIGLVFVGGVVGYTIRVLLDRLFAEADAREEAELRLRAAEAHQLHDDVVQDLTAAQLALALGDTATAGASIDRALSRTQRIVARLLQPLGSGSEVVPGSLRRTMPPAEPHRSDAAAS